MTKTKKSNRYLFGIIWGTTFLIFLVVSLLYPILSCVFVDVLPYLYQFDFTTRFIYVGLIYLFFAVSYLIIADKKQKSSVALFMAKSLKDRVGTLLGLLLFIYIGAHLAANSLGTLVKILPNQPYAEQMEVVNAKTRGSKMRSVDLDLKSNADGRIYYLALSKRLFNYPKFNIGDKLILKGKQNWLGVYVEEFQPEQ